MTSSTDYVEVWHARDGWRWRRKDATRHQVVAESVGAFARHVYALESATELNPEVAFLTDVDQ